MSALAIAPGERTGWAREDGRTGVLSVADVEDHGAALAGWWRWFEGELAREPLIYVAIGYARLPGGRSRNADLAPAMIRSAHAIAWRAGIPRTERLTVDVRRAVLGRGRRRMGETEQSLDAALRQEVERWGFAVTSPTAVDAAALLIAIKRGAS